MYRVEVAADVNAMVPVTRMYSAPVKTYVKDMPDIGDLGSDKLPVGCAKLLLASSVGNVDAVTLHVPRDTDRVAILLVCVN